MNNHQIKQFLENKRTPLYPFDRLLIQFCEQLSQVLLTEADTQHHPELIALAFWLRKGHLADLQENFQQLSRRNELIVPRGLAFHIAPANVETLFVYSWIVSLLVGNANVVRLPSRQSEATECLFSSLQQLLGEFPAVSETTQLLRYGHEQEITETISKQADVRLIWGGDETIETIRKIPLKVTAKELVFADRYAMAAFRTTPAPELFFRDLFWYDQKTCASPRALFWLYPEGDFYERLVSRSYSLPLSGRLNKITQLYNVVLDMPIIAVKEYGPLTVVTLDQFYPACRHYGGDGLLFHIPISSVDQIPLDPKDQTLVHSGLTEQELISLAQRGLDRIVPVGAALEFGAVWDGYDLLAELTRRVVYG